MGRLVIEGIDERLISDLSRLAAENGLSVDAQLTSLLRLSLSKVDRGQLFDRLEAIAAMTSQDGEQVDSIVMLRQDRER